MRRLMPVLLAACLWAAPASAQEEFWGVHLPNFGEETDIIGLYHGPSGNLVVKFIAGPRAAKFVDYYDTALKKRMAPEKARQIATDNALQRQVSTALRLKPVEHQIFGLKNVSGTWFQNRDLSGTRCEWPHDGTLTIRSDEEFDHFFVWKLPRPVTSSHGCGYRDVSVKRNVRTRYGSDYPSLYWSSGRDVYAVFGERYLVRFDHSGKTRFFEGRTDVRMVRSNEIETLMGPLTGWADSGLKSPREVQSVFDKIEAVFDNAFKAP